MGRPPKLEYPEDQYVRGYNRRSPKSITPAIDFAQAEPYYVRRLALRQLELVEQGMSEKAAWETIAGNQEKEMRVSMGKMMLEQIQKEEELELRKGLARMHADGLLDGGTAPPEAAAAAAGGGRAAKAGKPGKAAKAEGAGKAAGR